MAGRTRKARSDSAESRVSAFRAAADGPHPWPAEVTPLPNAERQERALLTFTTLQDARPRAAWKFSDLISLAHLAIAFQQLDQYQQLLETAGPLVRSKNGTGPFMVSPLLAAVQQASSRVESMSRRLGLAGACIDQRQLSAERANEREAAAAFEDTSSGLLAGFDDFPAVRQ